ncbi:hypothetical protein ONZ45_g10511 [Pleurotus djamor]|nr:hypothetical protein ONZ45_g10511 [Pleurotus djamor]
MGYEFPDTYRDCSRLLKTVHTPLSDRSYPESNELEFHCKSIGSLSYLTNIILEILEMVYQRTLAKEGVLCQTGTNDASNRAMELSKYAILSHRWMDAEISLSETSLLIPGAQIEGKTRAQQKLEGFFAAAQAEGCRFVWFDSGCIDQTNGPELDECIRSMFSWYQGAHVCIVYLQGIEPGDYLVWDEWFNRGWTLQELLAPKRMQFFSSNWGRFSRLAYDIDRTNGVCDMTLLHSISSLSDIDENVLSYPITPSPDLASAMFRYCAKRETTRLEDSAYCLISLLDVHMQIAYGEGPETAFYRLQLACLERSPSRTLFMWSSNPRPLGDLCSSRRNSALANHPMAFRYPPRDPANISFDFNAQAPPALTDGVDPSFAMTNCGLRIMMYTYDISSGSVIEKDPSLRDRPTVLLTFTLPGALTPTRVRLQYSGPLESHPKDLLLAIYGWSGETVYAVLLKKTPFARTFLRYEFAHYFENLPSTTIVHLGPIKPQWIYIR